MQSPLLGCFPASGGVSVSDLDDRITVIRFLQERPAQEFVERAAQRIVSAGGTLTENSVGRSIFPTRVDITVPVDVTDPARGGAKLSVTARLRIIVEVDEIFAPTEEIDDPLGRAY